MHVYMYVTLLDSRTENRTVTMQQVLLICVMPVVSSSKMRISNFYLSKNCLLFLRGVLTGDCMYVQGGPN